MLDGPDTRWASRKRAADAVIQSSLAIQEALDRIRVHRDSSPKAASEADGLLKKVRTFEFTLMLTSWNTLLKKIFALSNYLQQESFDVNTAVQLIDACMLQITELRSLEAFVAMENMARDLATLCKGATDYLQDRVRTNFIFYPDEDEDEIIEDSRDRFRVDVFYYILDVFVSQFEHRFADFRRMALEKFAVMNPKHFYHPDAARKVRALAEFYSEDLSKADDVVDEFVTFRTMYRELSMEKHELNTAS